MSTILIQDYCNLPSQKYPLEETQDCYFVVGHYTGSSFRVVYECDTLDSALQFIMRGDGKFEYNIYKIIVNIQEW